MPLKPKRGETVNTPNGVGEVTAVSEMNGYAHVQVGGQRFEVMFKDISEPSTVPALGDPKAEGEGILSKTNMFFDGDNDGMAAAIAAEAAAIDGGSSKHAGKWEGEGNTPSLNADGSGEGTDGTEPADGDATQSGTSDEGDPSQDGAKSEPAKDGGKKPAPKKQSKPKGDAKKSTPKGNEPPSDDDFTDDEQAEKKAKQSAAAQSPFEGLFGDVLDHIEGRVDARIDDKVDGELQELRDAVKTKRKLVVEVGDQQHTVEGLVHNQFETLVTYCALHMNTLLVGMAGTGKTHSAEQAANALGLDFYAISVGAQTSKTDIVGFMHAGGDYVSTHFRKAYEEGGVFLMDEIDAGNANVLITVNSALSNGYMSFPDKMVRKHKDFVFIASANTFGTGANRQYVGRNQLDAATLDRFAILEWHIDSELERSMSTGRHATGWYLAVNAARDYVMQHGIRALITPRATQKGSLLLEAGIHVEQVVDSTLLGSVPQDKQPEVRQVALKVFDHADPDTRSGEMQL